MIALVLLPVVALAGSVLFLLARLADVERAKRQAEQLYANEVWRRRRAERFACEPMRKEPADAGYDDELPKL